jgi:hypothetical protein
MEKTLTSVLRLIRFLMLMTALTATTWSTSQAVGSFQTRPAFPDVERDATASAPPTIGWPKPTASDFLGGCGRGRVSDPHTHGCYGPADIR